MGAGGMGHVLVVKRDSRSELFDYHFFYTNSAPLLPNHEYIDGYTDVRSTLEHIKFKRLTREKTHDFFPEMTPDPEYQNVKDNF